MTATPRLARTVVRGASPDLHSILETLVGQHDKDRLFTRTQGRAARYYGDFRDYADVGGSREALIPEGYSYATTDRDVALALLAKRLHELDGKRRGLILHGPQKSTTLYALAALDLKAKVQAGKLSHQYAKTREAQLRLIFRVLGGDADPECRAKDPRTVTVTDVRELTAALRRMPNHRGETYAEPTVLKILHALSSVFRRGASEGYVDPGYNPVAALLEKPAKSRTEAKWLEVPDAALLLESARTYQVRRADYLPFPYALIATWLLTGCRETEVYGLEVDDVSFERKTITIRPNKWRRLKTQRAARVIPLQPQLEAILREHFQDLERWKHERLESGRGRVPDCELVFPTWSMQGTPQIVQDSRKVLDTIAVRAGWKRGEIRTKMFRHTYCAARLQTLDRGAPISPFTVARELGHASAEMVENVYSHLGTFRHRGEAVEYRIEHHRDRLVPRLAALEAIVAGE